MENELSASRSNHYVIRLKGFLDPHWEWLAGLTVTYIEPGETILTASNIDQSALHGLLARIRDLNLTLLSLEQVDSHYFGKEG